MANDGMVHNEIEGKYLVLISGIMAAGKSTVAQALAERMPKSVHLRGDAFRRMIVNGRAVMTEELNTEARRQLHLRQRIAALAAREYFDAGFSVVYQDILVGDDLVRTATMLGSEVKVVVLCPQAGVVAEREEGREKTAYSDGFKAEAFDRVLREETPRVGLWLDSSVMSVAETVDVVVDYVVGDGRGG